MVPNDNLIGIAKNFTLKIFISEVANRVRNDYVGLPGKT